MAGPIHELLDYRGRNYVNWSESMKKHLIANDLWDIIEGTLESQTGDDENYKPMSYSSTGTIPPPPCKVLKPCVPKKKTTWQQKNAQVLQTISLACELSLSRLILEFKLGKDAWDQIKKAFGTPEPDEAATNRPDNTLYSDLMKKVHDGDWEAIKGILDEKPQLKRAQISPQGRTVLHLAVAAGKSQIVGKLLTLESMLEEVIELKDAYGFTALAIAAQGGCHEIAEMLLSKNARLTELKTKSGVLPVVLASAIGHADLTRYLHDNTPPVRYNPALDEWRNGATLVTNCIVANIYDIPLHTLEKFPSLAVCLDSSGRAPVYVLAQKTTSFLSGVHLAFWERWIYHCMPEAAYRSGEIRINIPASNMSESSNWGNIVIQPIDKFLSKIISRMKELKTRHSQTLQLLKVIFNEISTLKGSEFLKSGLSEALFLAIENGTIEFVRTALEKFPDLLSTSDKHGRHLFQVAVLQRQEKIFNLLYARGPEKYEFVGWRDEDGNYMVHHAAKLTPSRLRRRSGAALQFQSELQWFKEVEKITVPEIKDHKTTNSKTPRELFDEQHENLMKEGEKWMKDMASSSTIVATLIATVMFAAAFTVPGGNDQTSGFPMFLGKGSYMVSSFMVFIISDAISFFAAATAVLIFQIMLTSRYAAEDFLQSLPRKLIIGLGALSISIGTMMIAFGATLYMVLHDRIKWVIYPIGFLGSIPVLIFGIHQFRLLLDICSATYGRIFNPEGIPW